MYLDVFRLSNFSLQNDDVDVDHLFNSWMSDYIVPSPDKGALDIRKYTLTLLFV